MIVAKYTFVHLYYHKLQLFPSELLFIVHIRQSLSLRSSLNEGLGRINIWLIHDIEFFDYVTSGLCRQWAQQALATALGAVLEFALGCQSL